MLLFLILQNDDEENEGRISANGESGCTIHYTEKRNDVGITHTCAQTMGPTDMTTHFSNMSDFHKRSLRIFYRSLNVTISRQTHDKVQATYILLTYYVCRAYEATGLHTPGRQRHISSIKTNALIGQQHIWRAVSRREIAPEAIGRGITRVSRKINKSALIGQERYRAGSRREYRLV